MRFQASQEFRVYKKNKDDKDFEEKQKIFINLNSDSYRRGNHQGQRKSWQKLNKAKHYVDYCVS